MFSHVVLVVIETRICHGDFRQLLPELDEELLDDEELLPELELLDDELLEEELLLDEELGAGADEQHLRVPPQPSEQE